VAANRLYPPAPDDVPDEITQLDGRYRLRVLAMIGGLFLFLIIYLAFIVGAALAAYWLLKLPIAADMRGRNDGRAEGPLFMFKIGGVVSALLLLAF
jgi:hypothetical protein